MTRYLPGARAADRIGGARPGVDVEVFDGVEWLAGASSAAAAGSTCAFEVHHGRAARFFARSESNG